MTEKSDSKELSLATAPILGQPPRVARLAWPEVERRIGEGAAALLPVGAACKEHGYHLPMQTDCMQAEWFSEVVADGRKLIIWPTLTYGYYPAFVEYPGSCSLSYATFVSLAREVIDEILRWGVNPVFVLNTGISTIPPLEEAISVCAQARRVVLINIYEGEYYRRAVARLEQQAFGGHADEIETSIMLSIVPQQVELDYAVASEKAMQGGPLNRIDPEKANYSPSGVNGDPGLANADKGKEIVAAILQDIGTRIDENLQFKER